jgi:type II secretory ATPase GspE/PulE/Tfp pilus assembly ATPase PilB-like protein
VATRTSRPRLGELLVRAGVVTPEQVDAAAAVHRANERTIGQQLLADGAVTEVDLAAAVAYQLDIPFVLLGSYPIDDVAALLTPADLARRHRLLVVGARDDEVFVAMADATDIVGRDALAERTGRRIVPLLALPADIEREQARRTLAAAPEPEAAEPAPISRNRPPGAQTDARSAEVEHPGAMRGVPPSERRNEERTAGELVPFPRAGPRAVPQEPLSPEPEPRAAPAAVTTTVEPERTPEPAHEPEVEPRPAPVNEQRREPEREREPERPPRPAPLPRTRVEAGPEAQIVRFVLAQAIREGASDIHVEPLADRLRVRFRVEGALKEVTQLPRDMAAPVASRIRSLAGMGVEEAQGRLAVRDETRDATFDVSTVATLWGEKIVLRLMERGDTTPDLDDLGMEAGTLERWRELLRSPYGLVLVAGAPGMGKTTTLYASLRELETATKDVTTVEDPVAYALDGVNQVQVDRAGGASLASTLRRVLAQEPDVVLVSELRDKEVSEIAMNAALAGRLVLSTVQAADALGALYRIVALGADPYLVSASAVGVLAEVLVPRLCEHCRTATGPAMIEAALLRQAGLPSDRVFVARGCSRCNGTGRRGRVAAFELLMPSEELRSAIERSAKIEEAREIATRAGILTLREAGLRLVSEGLTTTQDLMTRLPTTGA